MKYFMFGALVLFALGCSAKHDFSEIEPASQQQLELINKGLDRSYKIERGCAVKSGNYKDAYYVAGFIDGRDEADVGIWWISGEKENPGIILAVDGFAIVYSSYPKASKTRVGAQITDDEAKLLKAYFKEEKLGKVTTEKSLHLPAQG